MTAMRSGILGCMAIKSFSFQSKVFQLEAGPLRAGANEIDALAHFADIFHSRVGRRVYFISVVRGNADIPREDSRHAGLSRPPPAGKKVRMCDFLILY